MPLAGMISVPVYHDKIKYFAVGTDIVIQMIKNINPGKAAGFDNIPGKLIRITYKKISISFCSLLSWFDHSQEFSINHDICLC